MIDDRKLSIIDESGKIIGERTREEIHTKGLLHKEIHVWLYTPKGEIIFQHREKDKDTYPNLLDATVGGHVEIGEDYDHAALKELQEETGIQAAMDFGGVTLTSFPVLGASLFTGGFTLTVLLSS